VSTGGFLSPVEEGRCACGEPFPWNRVAKNMRGVYRHRCQNPACRRPMVLDYHEGYAVRLDVTPAQWGAVKQLPEDAPMALILELLRTVEAA